MARALVLLSSNRLDVRRLLQWAEKSTFQFDAAAQRKGARESGLVEDVAAVSFALHRVPVRSGTDLRRQRVGILEAARSKVAR